MAKGLSIISINFNDQPGLKRTLDSIQAQGFRDFELVVIDGNSTDGSKELLQNRRDEIDCWVSEPDRGISDAFNKGWQRATRDYVLFLNAGDEFASPVTLETLMKEEPFVDQPDVVIGRVQMVTPEGAIHGVAGRPVSLRQQLRRNYFPHQAMFIRRDLFATVGGYDVNLKLGMDYDWSVRLIKEVACPRIKYTNQILAHMETGGVSMSNYVQTFMHFHQSRQRHRAAPFLPSLFWSVYFILRRSAGNFLRLMHLR